jgi:hypothetical protein
MWANEIILYRETIMTNDELEEFADGSADYIFETIAILGLNKW